MDNEAVENPPRSGSAEPPAGGAPVDVSFGQPAQADSPGALGFNLCWPSGNLIGSFAVRSPSEDDVEQFVQHCEEGLIVGVPRCRTTESGQWLEQYSLVYDAALLPDGSKLSQRILPNSTIHLIRTTCDPSAAHQ